MTTQQIIETLRAERDSLKQYAESFTNTELKQKYLNQARGINTALCILTSDDYCKLVAEQNGVKLDEIR